MPELADLIEFNPPQLRSIGGVGGQKPGDIWEVWKEAFDPDFAESLRKTTRAMATTRLSDAAEKGVKIVTQTLRDHVPKELETDIIEMMARNSIPEQELQRLTMLKNPKAVRAVIWDTLNAQKTKTPLGYVFRGFARGPHFLEGSPTAGKQVNWEDMTEKELRTRFIGGRGVADQPQMPIREMPEETLERAKKSVGKTDLKALKKTMPPMATMAMDTLANEAKTLRDEFSMLQKKMRTAGGDLFAAAMGEKEIDKNSLKLFVAGQEVGKKKQVEDALRTWKGKAPRKASKIITDPVGRAKKILDRLSQIDKTTHTIRGTVPPLSRMDILEEVRRSPFRMAKAAEMAPKTVSFGEMGGATEGGLSALRRGGKFSIPKLLSKGMKGGLLSLPLLLLLMSQEDRS